MKQTIYVICENASAFSFFAAYVNFLDFRGPTAPFEVLKRQSKWYEEHSNFGKNSVKVKAKMNLEDFIFFVYSVHQTKHNTLYCQNGVFVLK